MFKFLLVLLILNLSTVSYSSWEEDFKPYDGVKESVEKEIALGEKLEELLDEYYTVEYRDVIEYEKIPKQEIEKLYIVEDKYIIFWVNDYNRVTLPIYGYKDGEFVELLDLMDFEREVPYINYFRSDKEVRFNSTDDGSLLVYIISNNEGAGSLFGTTISAFEEVSTNEFQYKDSVDKGDYYNEKYDVEYYESENFEEFEKKMNLMGDYTPQVYSYVNNDVVEEVGKDYILENFEKDELEKLLKEAEKDNEFLRGINEDEIKRLKYSLFLTSHFLSEDNTGKIDEKIFPFLLYNLSRDTGVNYDFLIPGLGAENDRGGPEDTGGGVLLHKFDAGLIRKYLIDSFDLEIKNFDRGEDIDFFQPEALDTTITNGTSIGINDDYAYIRIPYWAYDYYSAYRRDIMFGDMDTNGDYAIAEVFYLGLNKNHPFYSFRDVDKSYVLLKKDGGKVKTLYASKEDFEIEDVAEEFEIEIIEEKLEVEGEPKNDLAEEEKDYESADKGKVLLPILIAGFLGVLALLIFIINKGRQE